MSLPRELLDELLSGYMDGELSADEHTRVEQMLGSDPAVRQHLRVLREQSQAVRSTIRSTAGLDAAFAERVLAATFAEAARTGVGEHHPLRLAATEQTRSHARLSQGRWRAVGGLAVAASLAAAAVFLWDGKGETPHVVTNQPSPAESQQNEATAAPQMRVGAAAQLATNEGGGDGGPEESQEESTEGEGERLAVSERLAAAEFPKSSRPEPGSITESRSRADAAELARDEPMDRSLDDGQSALRAVLVYQVQVTPLGREQGVINRAFREANIRLANQREVDDALVGYLQSSGVIGGEANGQAADDEQVGVMFLEGSGKQLEKLMLSLLLAHDEVRSVGFSLAMDPPVMAAIDTLENVDATEIRGDTSGVVAHSLVPADGPTPGASGRFTAGDRPFMPLGRDSLAQLSSGSGLASDDQADITARTLLIIRFD